jgi:hypothetical protein
MTTKPPLQTILQGILHTGNESKQNHERTGSTKPQEKKRQEIRVTFIQFNCAQKALKQQEQLNDRNHTYILMLTLNVNRFNSLSKDTIWQTGLKKKL